MEFKCGEEKGKICLKSNLCHLCDGARLYTPPKYLKRKQAEETRRKEGRQRKKKEGMDFEKKVQNKFNTAGGQARRQPNSGALWGRPGDIVTPDFLIECKERATKVRGEKSFTIHKQQLDKTAEESIRAGKQDWALVFGFRNDDKMYIIRDFDDELREKQYLADLEAKLKGVTQDGEPVPPSP